VTALLRFLRALIELPTFLASLAAMHNVDMRWVRREVWEVWR